MFVPRRMQKVLDFLREKPWEEVIFPLYHTYLDELRVRPEPQIFSILGMMNVKYIWTIVRFSEELVADNLNEVAKMEHWFEVKPFGVHPSVKYPLPLYLYENKKFLPRVFSAPEVAILKEDEDNFTRIIKDQNDFSRVLFIECTDCLAENRKIQSPPAIVLKEIKNDSITFTTEGSEEAWVVISNSFVPGWKARVDGAETPIYYANYIYQGIKVPEGKHEIVVHYE